MSLATLFKSIRNVRNRVEINVNQRLGRELIPPRHDTFYIETTGACNLKCRFCAYFKKQAPKVTMSNEFFADCIGQAVELGFHHFDTTPCTGDVFMDKQLYSKLEFLDEHPDVESYQFFTNFTIPTEEKVNQLLDFKKLEQMTISVYGHDRDSFIAITQSTEKVYRRLVANLDRLLELLDRVQFDLRLAFRSSNKLPRRSESELLELIHRYKQAGIDVSRALVYNNWGGYITQDDVKGLDIDITGTEAIYKKGACTRLLTNVQVLASGIVNGCACRDVEATLKIGDLRKTPLADILSTKNKVYMQLISEQQNGDFRPICRSCDFYKSIYHKQSRCRKNHTKLQTLPEFLASLDEKPPGAGGASRQESVNIPLNVVE